MEVNGGDLSRHHEDCRWLWGLRLPEKKESDSNSANVDAFLYCSKWNGQYLWQNEKDSVNMPITVIWQVSNLLEV
ncbi:hypothetical protein HLK66_03405 [Niallia circulans]|jgi:hypothetical protein|uniref:hypothetical protein n=1 Tax=Niallia circulans TaxID=1397 RepID=UPI0013D4D107|nr:hypothetical protein [Niallia circulans]QJX60789.1 hypothetical protein HLK66_03405 [Niallia circulans]